MQVSLEEKPIDCTFYLLLPILELTGLKNDTLHRIETKGLDYIDSERGLSVSLTTTLTMCT